MNDGPLSDNASDSASAPGAGPKRAADPLGNFRKLIQRSLAARLMAIATISVAGLIAVGWVAYAQFSQQLTVLLIDPEIASVADDLISKGGPGLGNEFALNDIPFDPRYTQTNKTAYKARYYEVGRIRDDGGVDVQVRSPSLLGADINLDPKQLLQITGPEPSVGGRFFDVPHGPDGELLRVVTRTAQYPGLDGRYLFLVAVEPREIVGPAARLVGEAFAAFIALCAFLVAAVTVLQIRVGLEPLSQLRRDIADVRRGQRDRLEAEYPAELQPVAQELNSLLDHNREVVERARRHVGNLAHALKTPIAVLKNAAADQAPTDVFRSSIDEMEAFVERQLRRARVAARAEATAGIQAPTVGYRTPVKRNLEDLVFMMEQKYDHQKAIDISLEAPNDATFRGEREDLLEMAANLIDNACKYGESQVIVRLKPPAKGEGVLEISVDDDGPGMSEKEIAQVLSARGTRLDEALPGQGFGLSILRETVSLYAGQLLFERGELGGLRARLRLPATD